MGREVRRVPPNWQHPKTQVPNHRLGRMEEDYQPMHDKDAEEAFREWLDEYNTWLRGEFERIRREKPNYGYDSARPYHCFCDWHGEPPDPAYYRPPWKEEEATWFQVYETVSEGTPVTPAFATAEELVDYLVKNGDFLDQKRGNGGWDRKNAEAFVGTGWAPSLMVRRTADSVQVNEPRDGPLSE